MYVVFFDIAGNHKALIHGSTGISRRCVIVWLMIIFNSIYLCLLDILCIVLDLAAAVVSSCEWIVNSCVSSQTLCSL